MKKPCQPSPPVHHAQIPIRAADRGAYVLMNVKYYQFSTSISVTETFMPPIVESFANGFPEPSFRSDHDSLCVD